MIIIVYIKSDYLTAIKAKNQNVYTCDQLWIQYTEKQIHEMDSWNVLITFICKSYHKPNSCYKKSKPIQYNENFKIKQTPILPLAFWFHNSYNEKEFSILMRLMYMSNRERMKHIHVYQAINFQIYKDIQWLHENKCFIVLYMTHNIKVIRISSLVHEFL